MKYIAIIEADEKPVSCEFIGCNGNATSYLIGATTNIKALEQEPTYIGELAQQAYEDGKKDGYVQAKVEQNPCDDILNLTKQVATQVTEDIDNFIFTTIKPWCEEKEQRKISKRDLEQALTQYFSKEPPCDDTISRQAVLKIQAKYAEHIGATKFWQMRDDIKALPPVTPQVICPGYGIDCKDCPAYEPKESEE